MESTRLVPHNIEAEEGVTGSLLIDGECLNEVTFLQPSDFFSETNRIIFKACRDIDARNTAIDQITVAEELERQGNLQIAGGAAYLSHLISSTPTSLDIGHYANIVHRLSLSRALISAASQIAMLGYDAAPDIENGIKQAGVIIETVKKRAGNNKLEITTPAMMSSKMLDILQHGAPSLSWGFIDLDAVTTGIYAQDYIVIGARPSVGKTEMMIETAENIGRTGKKVLFASTEMGINPVLERYIAKQLQMSIRELRKRELQPELNEDVEQHYMAASVRLSELPVYYLFGKRSSDSIAMNARKMQELYGLDCIFVDYLQLLTDCYRGGRDNHSVQVGQVSHNLKAITSDLNVPVIVASQLNRLVEYRENKRPMLADLRESGDIEQDADVVFLLHRPELYSDYEITDKGKLEIMMAKNRQLGMAEHPVKLQWIPDRYKYGNATR